MSFLITLLFISQINAESAKPEIQFNRDIRPIISDRCFSCHGPDEEKRDGDLRLDQEMDVYAALDEERFVIKAGNLSNSELYQRITATDSDEKMPPPESNKSLTTKEIEVHPG